MIEDHIQNGDYVIVERRNVAENGETFPPDGYLSSDIYKKMLDDPGFKRIAIAENILKPTIFSEV